MNDLGQTKLEEEKMKALTGKLPSITVVSIA
jgi:hypothetical protein